MTNKHRLRALALLLVCLAAGTIAFLVVRSPSYRPADALVFWSWYLDHAASVAIPPPTTL